MPFKYEPRVKETTTTTGTGTYTLAGAVTGYQTFNEIGSGNITVYCCTDGTNWEIGSGTYTASGTTLSRDSMLKTSTGTERIDWGSGSKDIFCVFPYTMLNFIQGDSGLFYSGTTTPSATPGTGSIAIGEYANASGNYSIAIGSNCISLGTGCVAIGYNNAISNASSYFVTALGRGAKSTVEQGHDILFATGYQDNPGDAQVHNWICWTNTTNGTGTTLGNDSFSGNGLLKPTANTTAIMCYDIMVVAMQYGGTSGSVGTSKAWSLKALAYYASGTPTRVGNTAFTVIEADAAASAWTCSLDFSSTYPILITGEVGKSIRWTGYVRAIEAARTV